MCFSTLRMRSLQRTSHCKCGDAHYDVISYELFLCCTKLESAQVQNFGSRVQRPRSLAQMKCIAILVLAIQTLVPVPIAGAHELQSWPYNLPRGLKYYPENEVRARRQEYAAQMFAAGQLPFGVRKMSSEDRGEKFRMEYWDFRPEHEDHGGRQGEHSDTSGGAQGLQDNTTLDALSLRAPLRKHTQSRASLFARSLLARAFQCPSGTHSCASIGHGNLCCGSGESCVSLSSGVGCCPSGQTCGGGIADCDTAAGYTSCPSSPDGGCCVPGARCDGSGCVFVGILTVTTTPDGHTSTSSSTTSQRVTVASSPPSTIVSVYTKTVTVTNSPSGQITTQTVTIATSSTLAKCSSGFFLCPTSLGGGCCRNGMICGAGHSCRDSMTSTITLSPPLLGTSVSSATTTTSSAGVCPGGYYACSAYYQGDCCQIGRNCDTTSCPPQSSKTVVSDGLTIVVSGSGAASASSASSTCASSWSLCPAAVGGGCCPSGYICGTDICTAPVSGEGDVGKTAPSSANGLGFGLSLLATAIVAGSMMIWL